MKSCTVDVWTIDIEIPRRALLSPEERARADRFRFERDREHWTNARSALREILSNYLNKPPLQNEFTYGRNGKPFVEGIEFNISHAGSWAMIAVAPGTSVGIDIESIRENIEIAKILERIGETRLSGTTAELFHVWTRREARTKAVGGLLMEVPVADLHVLDLKAPAGYAASLALLEAEPLVRYCGEGAR